MTPEEFMSGDGPAQDAEASRYVRGGYAIKDPITGDYRRYKNGNIKGITRVTTFVKAASDSKALNDWGKRNVLIGATQRPDIVGDAYGLTHDSDKVILDSYVEALEDTAGAKVSARVGTRIHELTEQLDRDGRLDMNDVPPIYRNQIRAYSEVLAAAGLEPIPHLIERTTMVHEFGGVVGTFDRVCLHRPSGKFVIVDVKTGKTLKYGIREIQAQMWLYAYGTNSNGLYDWDKHAWSPPLDEFVDLSAGVIVHMPVQGPDAGKVLLRKADLKAGRAYAELCHAVRSHPAGEILDWDGNF